MEGLEGEYIALQPYRVPAARVEADTPAARHWRAFRAPAVATQIGGVTCLDFSPRFPHALAATSSTRVVLYSGGALAAGGLRAVRAVSRFPDVAYSGRFRPGDGALLVAGCEDGGVRLFDAGSRALLRLLRGHARAARAALFAPGRGRVLSAGDDATGRLWDVAAGAQLGRLDGHADYVRAAGFNPAHAEAAATGGYDHAVRLWDARAPGAGGGSSVACTAVLDHGAPVEALAFSASGSLLFTGGGPDVCVWDLLGGGRLAARLRCHLKTVTALAAPAAGSAAAAAGTAVLSGSLDGHVRAIAADTLTVAHASRYPAPVLALALAPDGSRLAVGTADGAVAVRAARARRPDADGVGAGGARAGAAAGGAPPPRRPRYPGRLTAGSFRFFIRGQGARAAAADAVVAARRRAALAPYDRALRRFRYADALDAALAARRPEPVAALLQELAARGGGALAAAFAGRGDGGGAGGAGDGGGDSAAGGKDLAPLLAHVRRHVRDPRYASLLAGAAHAALDAAAGGVAARGRAAAEAARLAAVLRAELAAQEELAALRGMLLPLLAAGLGGGGEGGL